VKSLCLAWWAVTNYSDHAGDIGKAIEQMPMPAQALEGIKNGG